MRACPEPVETGIDALCTPFTSQATASKCSLELTCSDCHWAFNSGQTGVTMVSGLVACYGVGLTAQEYPAFSLFNKSTPFYDDISISHGHIGRGHHRKGLLI